VTVAVPAADPIAAPRRPSRRPRKRRRIRVFSILRLILLLIVYGASLGAASIYFAVQTINADLPKDLTELLDYQPSRKSTVLSTDGEEVGAFSIENRKIVPLDRMPPHVAAAFVAAEDRRFWVHPGFDLIGIARAAWKNFNSDDVKQGGSTITQQIIKQTILVDEEKFDPEGLDPATVRRIARTKKYQRKFKELILAVRIEKELTKAEILSIYLNHVYLGNGAYGVGAAAETYFGKDVENLTVAEAGLLAGLVASPSKYAPHRNIEAARVRQAYVLERMKQDGYISETEFQSALVEPIAIVDSGDLNHLAAPYVVEHVRRLATAEHGNTALFRGGLKFYATLDSRMQEVDESALRRGLEALDRRLGFRGPIGNLPPGDKRVAWRDGPPRPSRSARGCAAATGVSTARTDGAAVALVAAGLGVGMSADVGPDVATTAVTAEAERCRNFATSVSTEIDPDTVYAGLVVDLPRGGGVIVDLGPDDYGLVDKDADDVRAWRSDEGKPIAVGDLLPVRTVDKNQVTLAQKPALQGGIVAMDLEGRVVAMVGGYDWDESQFNRVTQAERQVGSAIKPFIYAAAVTEGATQVDRYYDGPIYVPTATGIWSPSNYDGKYHGATTLRGALARSLNTISVQLTVDVGLDSVIDTLRGFGVTSPIPRHISISLGTPDLTLLELAAGYAGIASGGRRVTPRFYDRVTDSRGNTIVDLRDRPPGVQVIRPDVAYVVVDMMRSVVQTGTAKAAAALGRPAAGKTGTSANFKDVWFIGFTPDLLVGVWIGRDDSTPIGDKITGGGAAVPIWLDFMQKAHPPTPPRDFPVPPDVTFARADPWSGNPSGPSPYAVWIPFARGTVPARFAVRTGTDRFESLVPPPPTP
jgi:penicillin-binding protein 1A